MYEAHAEAVQVASACLGKHYQGLGQVSRDRAATLSSRARRKLRDMDACYNVFRHITQHSVTNFINELRRELHADTGETNGDTDNKDATPCAPKMEAPVDEPMELPPQDHMQHKIEDLEKQMAALLQRCVDSMPTLQTAVSNTLGAHRVADLEEDDCTALAEALTDKETREHELHPRAAAILRLKIIDKFKADLRTCGDVIANDNQNLGEAATQMDENQPMAEADPKGLPDAQRQGKKAREKTGKK